MNPDTINPGTVIDLGGRVLTFRKRRFQDGVTVCDCVEPNGTLRTVGRAEMQRATFVRDPQKETAERLLVRLAAAESILSQVSFVRGVTEVRSTLAEAADYVRMHS